MKMLVCGGRDYCDYKKMTSIMLEYFIFEPEENILIAGGANGADSLAVAIANKHSIKKIIHKPDWDKYGKGAGFIRNQAMIDEKPNIVIAFWDGKSKGTADTINRARKNKITTLIVYY